MTEISVIIPSYKPDDYISDCLESTINQTLDDHQYEVIIVLNGPKEPYYSNISRLISNRGNFSLHYTHIAGVSNARNIGLDKSRGRYISFVDDDDKVSPNYLQSLLSNAEGGTVSASNVKAFDENSNYYDDYISRSFRRCTNVRFSLLKYRSFTSSCCGKLIPKNVINSTRFDNNMSFGEDSLFMFSISKNIKCICLVSNCNYYRRIRKGSATRRRQRFTFKTRIYLNSLYKFSMEYLRNPFSYNFYFFISRILAITKGYLKRISKYYD